jgi:hypothetical protein
VLSRIGSSAAIATALAPAILLIFFTGLLWLAGLACGKERRDYVTAISQQAMQVTSKLLNDGNQHNERRLHVKP